MTGPRKGTKRRRGAAADVRGDGVGAVAVEARGLVDRPTAAQVAGSHPFETEFGDHFATSAAALGHLAPCLKWLVKRAGRVLYDPFYCDGSVRGRLQALGFRHLVHENRDFWADVEGCAVPAHNVLVTNPPYSGDHKARLLRFVLDGNERRPACLLLPAYVVKKQWYREAVEALPEAHRPFFVLPRVRYEYDHPTGKGHETSPFDSLWIVFAFGATEALAQWFRPRAPPGCRVLRTVADLERERVVSAKKRKNPRARKRLRQKRDA